jgi:glycogen(starch) synthase
MRVLLTTDTVGGVWTFTRELSEGLVRLGHAVTLVSVGRGLSAAQGTWCEHMSRSHGEAFRYVACAAPLEWEVDNSQAYEEAAGLLMNIAADSPPDIFHSSQFCFGCLPLDIPRIITAHSDVLSWAAACRTEGLAPSEWLSQYCSLVTKGLAGAAAVAAPTCWMLNALRAHFQFSCRSKIILNGRSLPAISTVEQRHMQAISVGRMWDEAKNLSMLRSVKYAMPIIVAGEMYAMDGDHAASRCVDAAEELRDNFITVGVKTQEEILELFQQSAIYIAASVYEPFGLAPLEAALCGCAIVANDIESLREIWGDAALYFTGAAELDHLLSHLRESPRALAQAQQQSYSRALQLTSASMVSGYLALYSHLLEGRAAQLRPQHGNVVEEFAYVKDLSTHVS